MDTSLQPVKSPKQPPNEGLLSYSHARALELTRHPKGINRFEANLQDGHCSLGQRITELRAMGYSILKVRERWTDAAGVVHRGVVRYFCTGWNPHGLTASNDQGAQAELFDAIGDAESPKPS